MKRLLKASRLGLLLFILAMGFLASHVQPAHAAPNIGPDPTDIDEVGYYGNSYPGVTRQMKFAVSRDGYTDILNTRIKIYLPNPTGTITVEDGDLCYNDTGDSGKPNYDGDYQRGAGNMTMFRMTNTGSGVITRYGQWNGNNYCYNDLLTYNVSGSSKDPATGMYPYFLEVEALANGKFLNMFRVNAPSGAYVSQDSASDTPSLAVQAVYPIPPGTNPDTSNPPNPYRVYNIIRQRFGANCDTIDNPYRDYVEIYDDDNSGANNDVQPKPFHVRMMEYDRDGNYIRDLYPKSVMWDSVNHTSPTTNSAGGWNDDLVVDGYRYHVVYTTGNKRRIRLYYDFDKSKVYQWRLYNVYYDNTLQLKAPAESIYYYRECQQPDAKLKAGMSVNPAQVSPGQSATFTPSITVSGYRGNFTANCTIARTSYTPDGTPSSLGSQPCQTTGGNNNIPVGSNGTITLKANTYAVPSTVPPGSKVCDKITITSPSSDTYFANSGDKTAESCVKIIGRPFLQVVNNDVWAGSRFDYDTNDCSGQSARLSAIRSWAVSGSGANGQYGVLGLGPVVDFGSGGSPTGAGLIFANTPSQGSLGAATRCIPNYVEAIGSDGEPWPGYPAMTENMGKKIYYSASSMAMTVGGTVPKGSQVVLVVNGDLRIMGNINYANSYGSAQDISSLWVIVKGNIYIQDNVTSLQGFFVAQGTSGSPGKIHTCVKYNQMVTFTPLTTNVCNQGLDVYGALIADQVYWQRTRGTTASGQPYAESVQFDPGLYLNNPLSNGVNAVNVQDTKELPPIY